LVALVKFLGNTSVIWTCKVATSIDIRRVIREINRLKSLIQQFLALLI